MKPIGSSTLKIKKLTTPKKKIRNIIKRLPDSERIDLCASACFAISNIYPILTSDPKEVLDCYYNKRFMTRILAYLQHEKSLKLPKHITLKVNGRKLYIGPTYTKIPERELKRHNIKQEELEDCFVITKQQLSAEHDNLDSRNIMEAESLQNISDHSDHEFNENTFGNIRDDNANSEQSGDNGKYFPNLYLKKRLHNKFQLTSTKIRGNSLKGGGFTPKTPPERGFRGSEGGGGVN